MNLHYVDDRINVQLK